MDAQQYNAQLDKTLSEKGVVDRELFAKLREACDYDAASSVAWVEAKLRVLLLRVSNGHCIVGTSVDMSRLLSEQARRRAEELGVADRVKRWRGSSN